MFESLLATLLAPEDVRSPPGSTPGSSTSITAAVAIWPTGRLKAWARLPDTPDLATRGAEDGCGLLYADAHQAGELTTSPGRVVNAGRFLADVLDDIGTTPRAISCGPLPPRRGRVGDPDHGPRVSVLGHPGPQNNPGRGHRDQAVDNRLRQALGFPCCAANSGSAR